MSESVLLEGELDYYGIVNDDSWNLQPTIGDKGVIDAIQDVDNYLGGKKIEFLLGEEIVASGEVEAYSGWAGTDVTPGDPWEIRVENKATLTEALYQLDGKTVALLIREVEDE